MSKLRKKVIDRVVLPAVEGGVDYSAKRVVLFESPTGQVLWQRAGKCWSGVGMPAAGVPASLECRRRAKGLVGWESRALHEGGRLSSKLLTQYLASLNVILGLGVVDQLTPDDLRVVCSRNPKTIVFTERK